MFKHDKLGVSSQKQKYSTKDSAKRDANEEGELLRRVLEVEIWDHTWRRTQSGPTQEIVVVHTRRLYSKLDVTNDVFDKNLCATAH
jgi:hypothetical protein